MFKILFTVPTTIQYREIRNDIDTQNYIVAPWTPVQQQLTYYNYHFATSPFNDMLYYIILIVCIIVFILFLGVCLSAQTTRTKHNIISR